MLDSHLAVTIGDLSLDVELSAADREVVALLGPNGSGKTTIVRALAGLLPIDRGHIRLDDVTLDCPAEEIFVRPEHRAVGVVFQDYVLFPKRSVLDNVAFGLRARGADRATARAGATAWLERFDLLHLAEMRPAALSGGQAQRVALARTLAAEPRLLVLDEPMAALDATARRQVRADLGRQLSAHVGTRILVTHDPVDALLLADRLVIVEHGRVVQDGTPAHVAAHPASRFVADLVGINVVEGTAAGPHTIRLSTGAELVVADQLPEPGSAVAVAIRPQAIALHRNRPEGSARNTWEAVVDDLERDHDRVRVTVRGPMPVTAEITASAAQALGLEPGLSIWASVKAVDLTFYERGADAPR